MLTWKCHICGEIRPDHLISVYSTDISAQFGLPAGTMKQNVRYCGDNSDCASKARTFSFFEEEKGGEG